MKDEHATAPRRLMLSGEYDIARKQELASLFASVTNGAPLTIDMSEVTYIDSTFLSELATMRMRMNGNSVTLLRMQPNVERILRLAKLDRLFVLRD